MTFAEAIEKIRAVRTAYAPDRIGGFTLVELAIVLVIIGIVISLGVSLIGPLTKRIKYTESRDIVNGAVDSVVGYASGNNRLDNSTDFQTNVKNPNDAFGRALIYVYDGNLATSPSTKDTICGRSMTSITQLTTPNGGIVSKVAFLVLSRGDENAVDTTGSGTLNGSPINGPLPGSGYFSGTLTVSDNDIVKWVTLDELRTKSGCQGGQLKIINNELPYGDNSSALNYNAAIYADGGLKSGGGYQWKWDNISAFPGGLKFTCGTQDNLTSANWSTDNCTGLIITKSGAPPSPNTYSLLFTARDADNNTVSKSMILTINPS